MRWLALAMSMLLSGFATADANWRETGTSRAAIEGGQCVRDTIWMRKNHMELLEHDRDITVHQGIRTIDGSLTGCVACHANRDDTGHYVSIDGDGQFCAGCHAFAGVRMDCFTCHASVPEQPATVGAKGDREVTHR